ncbi:hypothetical protein Bca101_010440 [Brassica carinata]
MDPWVEKQKRRETKKMQKHFYMVSTNLKDKDLLPCRKYFTCNAFEDDGLHFRQPWVIGVEEEVRHLRKEVDDMAGEIAALKQLIPRV